MLSASHRRLRLLVAPKGHDSMKPATIIGTVLVVIGIIGFATGGLSFTHEKKVVDLGSVEISRKTQDTLPLSPIFSTVSLIVGLGLVVVGVRSK
jgi:preprotein translocase subunit Sss1